MIRSCVVAALVVLTVETRAQATDKRSIPLPDTLGAAFSIADSATKRGSPDDFDFLVGMWQFAFQQRNRDGTFRPTFTGHWMAEKLDAGGAMIEDRWRSDNAGAPWESGTYTYRVFNPTRGLWTIQGIEANRGVWQPGITWSDSTNRYVVQRNGTSVLRIRYFDITPNRFSWRADISSDGGSTWILDWWSMEVRRIGK